MADCARTSEDSGVVSCRNDGNFTDAGETNYATGTLVNNSLTFTGITAFPVGTLVDLRARVLDLAGNQGTSATATLTVNTSPTRSVQKC